MEELKILFTVFILFMVVCIVISFLIMMKILSIINESVKKMQTLKEREFLYSIDMSEENNFKLLDTMIEDSLTRYRVSYLEFDDDLYIDDNEQKKIITWIMKDILSNMSPVYYDKLTYIYNKNKLEDILYNKVSMAVLSYTVSINGSMRE